MKLQSSRVQKFDPRNKVYGQENIVTPMRGRMNQTPADQAAEYRISVTKKNSRNSRRQQTKSQGRSTMKPASSPDSQEAS